MSRRARRVWLLVLVITYAGTVTATADSIHEADHRECIDTSLVVGRSQCSWFGSGWAVPIGPRLQFSIGVDIRQLGEHGVELDVDDSPDDDGSTALARRSSDALDAGSARGDVVALGLRTTGEITRALYTGLDLSMGPLRLADPALEARHRIRIAEDGFYFGAGGLVGLVGHLGPLVGRGEILGGMRLMEIPYTMVDDRRSRTSIVQPVVEPRVAAELWLGPWLTVGAHVGSDLLRSADYVAGIYLSLYDHGWDGSRSR